MVNLEIIERWWSRNFKQNYILATVQLKIVAGLGYNGRN